MKRFWERAEIDAEGDSYLIRLDGRPMRLPSGETLLIDHRSLADAIAAEWGSPPLGAEIAPNILPLTQLAATARFRIAPAPAEAAASIAAYARSDLLCYRAEEPADLVLRQQAAWQPPLFQQRLRLQKRLPFMRAAKVAGVDPCPFRIGVHGGGRRGGVRRCGGAGIGCRGCGGRCVRAACRRVRTRCSRSG